MYTKIKILLIALSALTLNSCVFEEVANDPVPYYADQIKRSNLIVKVGFEDKVTDEMNNLQNGTGTNITYVQGIKGKAYQGSDGGFIAYNTVSDKIGSLTSLTITMWVKTAPHNSGAQCLYMIPKNQTPAPFWGNSFILIESNTSAETMPTKVHFEKNLTNGSVSEQWVNHVGQNAPQDAYNKWTHLAWTYDGVTSKYYFYVNGQNITPDVFVDRYNEDDYLGFLNFVGVDKFILGGFQQHLGTPWNAPEPWMKTFTGAMDEFRIYDATLTPQDIFRLYSIEKQGL